MGVKVRNQRGQEREGQAKALTVTEEIAVYAKAKEGRHAKRDVCMLDFSFRAGLRAKEIAALMIEDVTDAKGNVVESFHLSTNQAKGDTGGEVRLGKRLRASIKAYLEERADDNNRHLFKSQGGGFNANTIQQRFATLYKRAEIKGASSHSGRRTFATRLCKKGLDLKSISVMMRHKNISTTARYIEADPTKLARAAEDL
ncbi:MAG: site-specific integrase [Chlorobium sp.]|nr:site-specific integrase [Chlorobium sp.]